jgi:hypothetical protein
VVFDRGDKVAGLALEFPYPRPGQPEQRRRQWEQGKRRGGFIVRNPDIDGLMRHSALAGHQGHWPAGTSHMRLNSLEYPLRSGRAWCSRWRRTARTPPGYRGSSRGNTQKTPDPTS